MQKYCNIGKPIHIRLQLMVLARIRLALEILQWQRSSHKFSISTSSLRRESCGEWILGLLLEDFRG